MSKSIITQINATRWFSVAEIAESLGVSTKTVRDWIKSGSLPALKLSSRLFKIPEDALIDFLSVRGLEEIKGYINLGGKK